MKNGPKDAKIKNPKLSLQRFKLSTCVVETVDMLCLWVLTICKLFSNQELFNMKNDAKFQKTWKNDAKIQKTLKIF